MWEEVLVASIQTLFRHGGTEESLVR